ncbi:MAG: carboxymuconolactone decarboxylase family protein [Acetobacteraceae bacterium]|nr:carboxymuconolactone decarboxylase family protein [Acetobacteraceae bacterium]
MTQSLYRHGVAFVSAVVLSTVVCVNARAQDSAAAYRDIEQTLGSVPTFFKLFPQEGIDGAWAEFKTIQLNPKTALSGKEKELIGLAVAAQIPCSYCIYFHTAAAKLNGASDEEIREAVAMAAITRHWSTVLNGMQADPAGFRQETDAVLRLASERMKAASNK